MGSTQVYPIKIFCFGNKDGLLQKVFPDIFEINDEQNKDKLEHRIFKKSESIPENETKEKVKIKIEWRATIYPDITDDNINELFEDLTKKMDIPKKYDEINKIDFNDSDSREKSKNIIIKFGKNNSNYLINYMDDIPKTHLPQISIVTDDDFNEKEEGLNDNRYLSIIKNVTQEKLYEYLWEKDCYYNERGTIPLNISNDIIETNNYINILLTGLSRSGKSTLINVLSQKLVTLESPFLESVTNKIREYKISTSKNGKFQTGIRFFDTPGLIINKNRNTVEDVKSLINKKMRECKDIRDDIHLIYFVLRSLPNLENYISFFKYLIELKKQRRKENRKTIHIIFIFNGSNSGIENSMIEFLKKNKLEELIEVKDKEDENEINFKEKYAKKNKRNKKEIKYNIIRVNLLKDEDSKQEVYGIDSLLNYTLYILKKENPFNELYFKQL